MSFNGEEWMVGAGSKISTFFKLESKYFEDLLSGFHSSLFFEDFLSDDFVGSKDSWPSNTVAFILCKIFANLARSCALNAASSMQGDLYSPRLLNFIFIKLLHRFITVSSDVYSLLQPALQTFLLLRQSFLFPRDRQYQWSFLGYPSVARNFFLKTTDRYYGSYTLTLFGLNTSLLRNIRHSARRSRLSARFVLLNPVCPNDRDSRSLDFDMMNSITSSFVNLNISYLSIGSIPSLFYIPNAITTNPSFRIVSDRC